MTTLSKIRTAVLVSAALVLATGSVFAAAPVFTTAAPGNGMAIDEFASQLAAFNAKDVTDFVGAKTVSVIKYDTAWTDRNDMSKAVNMLTDDSQFIGLLRNALKANPAASKLLADNHINVNDVVDITANGQGAATIYVS